MRSERMTRNIFLSSVKSIALFMLCFAIGITSIMAQSTVTGAIRGKVTDQNGAVVPNATVKITNTGTNSSVTTTASDEGAYEVRNLQPGTYKIEVNSGS